MPQIQFHANIAAGAVVDPLEPWQYRYAPFAGHLRAFVWEVVAHADFGAPHILATITAGSDTLMQESPLSQMDVTDITGPILPAPTRVIPVLDEVAAGDLLKISLRNADASNPRVYAGIVELIPAGA